MFNQKRKDVILSNSTIISLELVREVIDALFEKEALLLHVKIDFDQNYAFKPVAKGLSTIASKSTMSQINGVKAFATIVLGGERMEFSVLFGIQSDLGYLGWHVIRESFIIVDSYPETFSVPMNYQNGNFTITSSPLTTFNLNKKEFREGLLKPKITLKNFC